MIFSGLNMFPTSDMLTANLDHPGLQIDRYEQLPAVHYDTFGRVEREDGDPSEWVFGPAVLRHCRVRGATPQSDAGAVRQPSDELHRPSRCFILRLLPCEPEPCHPSPLYRRGNLS